MKLVRFGPVGKEKPGMIDAEGKLRDLSSIVPDWRGDTLSDAVLNKVRRIAPARLPLVKGRPRLGCPVAQVSKFVAIGLNYADHAAESGMAIPK